MRGSHLAGEFSLTYAMPYDAGATIVAGTIPAVHVHIHFIHIDCSW